MKKNILVVTFSPGGGCLELAEVSTVILSRAGYEVECLDITYASEREAACGLEIHVDLMLMIAPVYPHRLPPPVEVFIERSQLFVEKAALILGYGSCGVGCAPEEARKLFDDAEVPLCRIMTCPLPHTFADCVEEKQELPESLGEVGKFILSVAADDDREESPIIPRGFDIIGRLPYNLTKRIAFSFPKTVSADCTFCGTCATACPTEAIGDTPDKIDPERCIKCMRCAAVCPTGARKLDEKVHAALRERLAVVCGTRKENELFL